MTSVMLPKRLGNVQLYALRDHQKFWHSTRSSTIRIQKPSDQVESPPPDCSTVEDGFREQIKGLNSRITTLGQEIKDNEILLGQKRGTITSLEEEKQKLTDRINQAKLCSEGFPKEKISESNDNCIWTIDGKVFKSFYRKYENPTAIGIWDIMNGEPLGRNECAALCAQEPKCRRFNTGYLDSSQATLRCWMRSGGGGSDVPTQSSTWSSFHRLN
ncbi:hypothetical protein N7451_005466 [Penicillium sp. IBT 35674x]|nr:hypothetical protein N7451_005466 [Penicillium sp. IBT 35674x]